MSDAEEIVGGSVAGGGSLTGKLLVAEPMLADPNFDRAVVLILDHGQDGAHGVVLNRPTDVEVGAVLEDWGPWALTPEVLHLGGPVEQTGVIGLARCRADEEPPGWSRILDDLGSVDLDGVADSIGPHIEGVRFFAGYSGWAAGQLEAELAEDAWLVVDLLPADVFTPDPGEMWRSVLRRQSGKVGMLANFPFDPSLN